MNMKKSLTLILLFCLTIVGKAQITVQTTPPAWNNNLLSESTIPDISLPPIDIERLLMEDSIEAINKTSPFRFGVAVETDIDLKEKAEVTVNGDMTRFQLTVSSSGAYSLNFNFSNFHLPEGSLLYLRGVGNKDVLGALSNHNNKADGEFSTRPIKGSQVEFDLYVPSEAVSSTELRISSVVHAYKDVFHKNHKNFNSSGNCNRNINCPEADLWQDVKRSVVLILASNNTRLCTGTLLNNVREDSTPYILSASHCNLATNSIFVFGYENSSSNCQVNLDGSLSNSISGAFSRSRNSYSDFHLFELSSTPPPSYNAYYAGWDASGNTPYESTTIHHPSGDIKKFSQDHDSSITSTYGPPRVNSHWQVGNWELGTTEQGSSGAAQFDQFKRVIGQLEGGSASCTATLEDYFGKLALSWDYNQLANRQLQRWLDPDTTNTLVMDGLDPLSKSNNQDVELTYLSHLPSFNCSNAIQPVVHFMNVGNDSLTSVQIHYGTNGLYNSSQTWTGVIYSDKMASKQLPSINLSASDTVFNVRLTINPQDQDTSNNSIVKKIGVNTSPVFAPFKINTDEYGNETSWDIRDSLGRVIHKGGPYVLAPDTSGKNYLDTLCLFKGCFDFTIYDGYGDGFNSMFNGNGYVVIKGQTGDTILYEANFTGSQKTIRFCVNDTSTFLLENDLVDQFQLFPNPVRKGESIQLKSQRADLYLRLIDMNGREIARVRGNSIEVPVQVKTGIYILQIEDRKEIIGREKVIVR